MMTEQSSETDTRHDHGAPECAAQIDTEQKGDKTFAGYCVGGALDGVKLERVNRHAMSVPIVSEIGDPDYRKSYYWTTIGGTGFWLLRDVCDALGLVGNLSPDALRDFIEAEADFELIGRVLQTLTDVVEAQSAMLDNALADASANH